MGRSNTYGAVELGEERDSFVADVQQQRVVRNGVTLSWGKIAVGAAVGVVAATSFVTMHSTLTAQQATIAKMQQQLDAMHTAIVGSKDIVSNSAKSSKHAKKDTSEVAPIDSFPSKFAVQHVTPLKTQDERGTCWDFASVGVLEQTYRAQGIENGWLAEDEYVALSEQAYGAEVLRLCSGPPGSPQQVACLIPGNDIWKNSTEGGESAELFYLVNGLKNSIFPNSICPYIPDDGEDTLCPALTTEARATNPLSIELKKMDTLFETVAVKEALLRDGRAMAFTTSMPYITHYYPCIGSFANDPRCNPSSDSCTLCPREFPATTCCIPVPGGMNYNMNGEFLARSGMSLEGGHVMTLVGYNDLYRVKDGFTGGFILKNSWFDGTHPALGPMHARGSHTAKYWMQEISDWDERTMCPNSHNPENWYQCGESGEVVERHARRNGDSSARVPLVTMSLSTEEEVDVCLTAETELYARTNIQPLHLRCTDSSYCDTSDASLTYFVRNMTAYGDHMQIMCLFEYHTNTTASRELCLPPLLVEQLAYVLTPVDEEALENDPDVCGHYFYPYEVQQQYSVAFGNFYVNNFAVEWQPQSYAANSHKFPHLDYSYVLNSTRKQNQYDFVGPFPFARVVDTEL